MRDPDNDGDLNRPRQTSPEDNTTQLSQNHQINQHRESGSGHPRLHNHNTQPQPHTRQQRHPPHTRNTRNPPNRNNTQKRHKDKQWNQRDLHAFYGNNTDDTTTTNNQNRNNRTRPVRRNWPTREEQETPFGDTLTSKAPGVARLVCSTLGPKGATPSDRQRTQLTKDFIRHTEADISAWYETGSQWDNIPRHQHPMEIYRTNTALRCQTSHNKHDGGKREGRQFQHGGTMILAHDAITTRMIQKGQDQTGLGRWSWMLMQGKNGIRTRFISAYCPVKNNSGDLNAVYAQHGRWLRHAKKNKDCPRKVFLEDLCQFLSACRQNHERVAIFMDANDDVRQSKLAEALAELDLREAITSHHPDLKPPATYIRGSRTIDGIFLSPELQTVQAGFMAFGPMGDHRPAYVDIAWDVLLGDNILRIERPPARRLTTEDPRVVRKYNRLLEKYLVDHDLLRQIIELDEETHHLPQLTPPQVHKLERLDHEITIAMRYAEKRCRKLKMGALDFSIELIHAWDTKRMWKLVKERAEGLRRSRMTIRRLAKRLNIQAPMNCTKEEATRKYHDACVQYKTLKPTAGLARQDFLTAIKDDPMVPEDERKRAGKALQKERAKAAARQIHRIKDKMEGGAIREIELYPPEGQQGPPRRVTEAAEVVQEIMSMVQLRYKLTESTPLMSPETQTELGLTADTPMAQNLLQGTYQPTSVEEEYAIAFLQQIYHRGTSPPISLHITTVDYISYWKKAREDTSSSISGRHFGHYKASATNPTLTYIHTAMCNMSYGKGFPLTRWKSGLTVMLEKEPGVIDVEKLRAILLLEADFNFVNKLYFGTRMITRAHQEDLIPPECFGGVKHRNPHHLALTRKCFIDLSTIMLTTIAVASVDAAQCYDRIQHTAASLACQAWGVPRQGIATLLHTVQAMRIYLRTAHGDSDSHIDNDPDSPFQGILQGNGAGPAIWLAISAFLVYFLKSRNHTTRLRSPITGLIQFIVGLLFVDDTDIIITATPGESDVSVLQRLQEAVDCWQGALQTTGGALKKKKCAWAIKSYDLRGGGARPRSAEDLPGNISITENGERVNIQRKAPEVGVKAVGFIQSLDGAMTAQFAAMKRKADKWGRQIKHSRIDRRLAWHAIRTTIWPSLKFPLSACTFTWKQGDQLVSKLYKSLLPSLGANRNFPKLWRHAPPDFIALDLPHPVVEQGVEQFNTLFTLGASHSLPGISLRSQLEAAQIRLGTAEDFLHENEEKWGHLLPTNTLARNMWAFAWEHGIYAELEIPLVPPAQRNNDTAIMELVDRAFPNLSAERRSQFNTCRCAKQVYYLSDITTGDGTRILPAYIRPNNRTNTPPRASKWDWPQTKPTANDWTVWESTLRAIFPQLGIPPDLRPKGWIGEPHLHMPWFYDPVRDLVWEHSPTQWTQYEPIHLRGGRTHYTRRGHQQERPNTPLTRTATITTGTNRVAITGFTDPPPTQLPPQSLENHIATLGKCGWPIQTAWFPHQGLHIAQAIKDGTAIGVSDGSYQPNKARHLASAGWIILDLNTHQQTGGVVRVSGTKRETNAYRAELQGLHAMLLAVHTLCKFHQIAQGSIILGLDNEKGVDKSKDTFLDPTSNTRHVDLIRAIRRIIAQLPITVHLEHVRGHQDEKANRPLTPLESLNVAADTMAKTHLHELIRADNLGQLDPCPDYIYMEGTRLTILDKKITTDPSPEMRHAIFAPKMKTTLADKGLLTTTAFDLVDWEATRRAAKESPPLFRLWAAKNASGQCGVGKYMHLWGYWEDDRCPLCLSLEETTRHVSICPSLCARQARNQAIDKLATRLDLLKTAPTIQHCLLEGIRNRHHSFLQCASPDTREAALEQDEIGWAATIEGRLGKTWQDIQETHYLHISAKKGATAWAAEVVVALWEFTHHIWNARCKTVKDMERAEELETQLADLDGRIRHLVTTYRAIDYPHEDRQLFDKPLQELLGMPIADKHTWLQAVAWAREVAEEENDNDNAQMRDTMMAWLQSATTD